MAKVDEQNVKKDVPKGERFSHVYLKRGEPTQDNFRMRRRLASLVDAHSQLDGFGTALENALGVRMRYNHVGVDWDHFFEKCQLSDLLDAVTVGYRLLIQKARSDRYGQTKPRDWLVNVQSIFDEENVCYEVDDSGGVHLRVDDEFERTRASTIAALNGSRYSNVLAEFERADSAFVETLPNGKGAIRATFSAAEGLFRLMFPTAPRLAASEIEKHLSSALQRIYSGDPTAARAAAKVQSSFKEWVDAAHFYRHEAGKEEVAQPPLALAINLVSLGASYIRWLAEIDAGR